MVATELGELLVAVIDGLPGSQAIAYVREHYEGGRVTASYGTGTPSAARMRCASRPGGARGGFDYSTLDAVGNPSYLLHSAHMSARRLGVDAIGLYYLHSGRALDAPFEDEVGVLAELRQAGLIRHVGLSNVTLEQLRVAQSIVPVAAVTALYNVTARMGAGLRAAARLRRRHVAE